RRFWMKPQSSRWWEETVLSPSFSDEDWLGNFRVTRPTFFKIVELVRVDMEPSLASVRSPVPCAKRVGVAMYKLASNAEYRVIGNLFGIHKSTVHKCLHTLCRAVTQRLMPAYIALPDEEEACRIMLRFHERYHLPQVMGVIDATHIPIIAPRIRIRDFINRMNWASYILQAVVDDTGRFRNISCRIPGSAYDAAALMESELYQQLDSLPKAPVKLEGVDIPLHLLGDAAYPLMPWLLKGYPGEPVTPEEESYNAYLGSAHLVIEDAFRRLKGRWRILLKRMEMDYRKVPLLVATCCILHNFCESQHEVFMQAWIQDLEEVEKTYPQPPQQGNIGYEPKAMEIRTALCRHMAHTYPL
uniref:DDE Tnp4 domain-containing protein n=1 Tax=Latimeria chalumnae TaxID=7897 RepID=H3A810_LATCH